MREGEERPKTHVSKREETLSTQVREKENTVNVCRHREETLSMQERE